MGISGSPSISITLLASVMVYLVVCGKQNNEYALDPWGRQSCLQPPFQAASPVMCESSLPPGAG